MHYAAGRLVFSPTDLVVFLHGDFASWMDRWHVECCNGNKAVVNDLGLPNGLVMEGIACVPDVQNDEMALIYQKGIEHEKAFLQRLRDEDHDVEIIKEVPLDRRVGLTIDAMRRGAAFIYQGGLKHEEFGGFADFLVRQPGASQLGDYFYQAWDTKLARSLKPYFIIQLCAYSEMLAPIQGKLPDNLSAVLGNGQREQRSVRKYLHYFRSLRRKFLNFHANFSAAGFPDPGLCRSHGRWSTFAAECLRATDHLSQVATITGTQIKKLEAAGIGTFTDLATTATTHVPRLNPAVFERLKCQAHLQWNSKEKEKPLYEVRRPVLDDPRRGLALLPPPTPHDVVFDIEGFPLADDGLEYLLGVVCLEQGQRQFLDWWSHTQQQERRAFQDFVDWLHARWKADPTMHVYHYASYETAALRRLMGKHATREREVDDLLRNHVFVDLYTVVRQGLTIGTPGYSLKDIETLYLQPREGGITTAGGSVVAYHSWMESGQSGDWRESPLLKEIRDYNRVDCESTWMLTEWLRTMQRESGIEYIPLTAPSGSIEDAAIDDHPSTVLAEKLFQEVNDGDISDPEQARGQQLLAGLLEFHWREAKPVFWRMFDRAEMTEQELIDDLDCLGGLQRTSKVPRPIKQSWAYEFKYDPDQDTKLHDGSNCYFSHDLGVSTSIETFDADRGLLEIKLGPKKSGPPDRLNLIPNEYVSASVIADGVLRYVSAWSQGTILSQAVDDLVHRRPPRLRDHDGGSIIRTGGELVSATVDVIGRMDQTILCIQGPPGTGKTYTAAQAILALMQAGKRVGVTANSHKAILNVLRAVHEARNNTGARFRIVKVGSTVDDPLIEGGAIEHVASIADGAAVLGNGPVVIGGTAWPFCRPELQGAFDYLFIDEAGQFSLANTVSVGLSTNNLVLVGDQMQLAQPVLGTHPGDSGQSALNYLLAGHATIPPEMGVFLDQTWRLHPDICGFVSEAVYDGRLRSHPRAALQRIETKGGRISKQAGIVFVPVEHEGNSQGSDEEAAVIQEIVAELVGCRVWDAETSEPRRLTLNDILFVAPFNMQVRLLSKRLGSTAHVGSVDRFQGQEAHVVVVSMCSSTLEDSPRGADFLLEPNRLNVAVSRAKSLAIVVANPNLVAARCKTIREMELANLFCWLVDYARGEA